MLQYISHILLLRVGYSCHVFDYGYIQLWPNQRRALHKNLVDYELFVYACPCHAADKIYDNASDTGRVFEKMVFFLNPLALKALTLALFLCMLKRALQTIEKHSIKSKQTQTHTHNHTKAQLARLAFESVVLCVRWHDIHKMRRVNRTHKCLLLV